MQFLIHANIKASFEYQFRPSQTVVIATNPLTGLPVALNPFHTNTAVAAWNHILARAIFADNSHTERVFMNRSFVVTTLLVVAVSSSAFAGSIRRQGIRWEVGCLCRRHRWQDVPGTR